MVARRTPSANPGIDQQITRSPSTVGVIALSAKMAKADGIITRDEVKAFKEAFRVSDGEIKQVARIFNLAKEDVTGYEAFAEDLVNVFKGNRELLEDVLEVSFTSPKPTRCCTLRKNSFSGTWQALRIDGHRVQLR